MLLILPGQIKRWSNFYYELAQLSRSGILPLDALKKIQKDGGSQEIRQIARQLAFGLSSGRSLTTSMRPLAGTIPSLDQALLAAGETSGRMEQSLRALSSYYERDAQWRSKLIGKLLYPLALLVGGVLLYPSGHLKKIIDGDVIGFFKPKILPLGALIGCISLPVWLSSQTQSKGIRSTIENFLHSIPLLGQVRAMGAMARFCLALEGLVSAGLTPDQSWPMAARASGSIRLEATVSKILPQLKSGKSPSDLISGHQIFPAQFISQYKTGELAGQIDESLKKLAFDFSEAAENKMQVLINWLPRIIYAFAVFMAIKQILAGVQESTKVYDEMLKNF